MPASFKTKLLVSTLLALSSAHVAEAASAPVFTKSSFQGGTGLAAGNNAFTQSSDLQNHDVFTLNQTAAVAKANFDNLNLVSGQTLNINQAKSGYLAFLKVTDNLPTSFGGDLTAKGNVVIQNAAGITFAGGSNINVGALNATTAGSITLNSDGSYKFGNFSDAGVNFQGNVDANGYVIALAKHINVDPEAAIFTNEGTVDLSAGSQSYNVTLSGNSKIVYSTANFGESDINATGSILNAGAVVFQARANDIYSGVININGIVDSKSFTANSAGDVNINAAMNPAPYSSSISALNAIKISAGKDINIQSSIISGKTVALTSGGTTTMGTRSDTSRDSSAIEGRLTLNSGADVNLSGAIDGNTTITALKGNVTLAGSEDGSLTVKSNNVSLDEKFRGGPLNITAAGDVNLNKSNISTDGAKITAGGNLNTDAIIDTSFNTEGVLPIALPIITTIDTPDKNGSISLSAKGAFTNGPDAKYITANDGISLFPIIVAVNIGNGFYDLIPELSPRISGNVTLQGGQGSNIQSTIGEINTQGTNGATRGVIKVTDPSGTTTISAADKTTFTPAK